MSEINDAIQILRVAFEGGELIFKVSNATLEELKKLTKILFNTVHKEKMLGKTSMKKLLRRGGDLHVFQFESKDLKKVERLAKKYGILYSLLPDINKKDNMSELVFHTESTERINSLIAKLKTGRVIALEDYYKNGEAEEIVKEEAKYDKRQEEKKEELSIEQENKGKETKESRAKESGAKESITKENGTKEKGAEKAEELKKSKAAEAINKEKAESAKEEKNYLSHDELERIPAADKVKILNSYKDERSVDITISKKLVVRETEHSLLMRIPFEKDKYFWMKKTNLWRFNQGRTLLGFLQKEAVYKIYSATGVLLDEIKGKDLYRDHYDKVNPMVKEKIGQIEKTKGTAVGKKAQEKESPVNRQILHETPRPQQSRRR